MGVNNESNTEHARHGYEVHVCNLAKAVPFMIYSDELVVLVQL